MNARRCLLLAGALLAGATRAGELVAPEPIPAQFFGMHVARAHDSKQWPRMQFGSWRLWDAGVTWAHLEPEPGVWRWHRLDMLTDLAERSGVEVLLPLAMTPQWASARPERKSFYGPGQASEPADPARWENYVRAVATRYRGRIRHYEIWNEPASSRFFNGGPQALLALQRSAYRILKEVDPANVVVAPATTRVKDLDWFDRYLGLGAADHADVIGYHLYGEGEAPEAIVDLVAELRARMARHGVRKPLWNTEAGFRTGGSHRSGIPPDAFMLRTLVLARAAGVERFYYYSWDHAAMGLQEGRSGTINAAGRAFDFAATRLVGARDLHCPDRGALRVCALTLADGTPARMVWTTDGTPRPWRLPDGWEGALVRTPDTTRTVHGDTLLADGLAQLVSAPAPEAR